MSMGTCSLYRISIYFLRPVFSHNDVSKTFFIGQVGHNSTVKSRFINTIKFHTFKVHLYKHEAYKEKRNFFNIKIETQLYLESSLCFRRASKSVLYISCPTIIKLKVLIKYIEENAGFGCLKLNQSLIQFE